MSRSCQRATFSRAAMELPRRTRARPQTRSHFSGLRLWGMELEPCWPRENGSSASPTSLRWRWRTSVAKRSREAPIRARVWMKCAWRSRETTCVLTASTPRPRRLADGLLQLRRHRGVTADRSAELADSDVRLGGRQAAALARRTSSSQFRSLRPKVMGSACMPWVRPIISVSLCSTARRVIAASSSAQVGLE